MHRMKGTSLELKVWGFLHETFTGAVPHCDSGSGEQ